MNKKGFFQSTGKLNQNNVKKYRSQYFLKKAWTNFIEKQEKDEQVYLEAILGLNKLKIIFAKDRKKKKLGKNSEDLVYGYWTEEDIRLKLSAELLKFENDNCRVHGQTHIYKKKNERRLGRRKKYPHQHKYPDILFIALKLKEKSGIPKNENLEVTAIEIKYFSTNEKLNDVNDKIQKDLEKIKSYINEKSNPKVDCGYFFCIDESKNATKVLKKLLKQKSFKKLPLAYGVLIPRYTSITDVFPAHYEKYDKKYRKLAYLLDIVRERVGDSLQLGIPKLRDDRILMRFNNKLSGWLGIIFPEFIKKCKRNKFKVLIKVKKPSPKFLLGFSPYIYSTVDKKWEPTKKKNPTFVSIHNINQRSLGGLVKIENEGKKLSEKMKKLIKK